MRRILLMCVLISIESSISVSILPTKSSNIGLTPEQIIKKYGYPFEQHTVETSDGYLLTLHRIPYGVKDNSTEKPRSSILIMHGILGSSADFVNIGPEKALGFLMADAGYDVWLANHRGNTWSRKHVDIDPDTESAKFFNFSFHEIATLDLPAKIDYILATTKQDGLFYIGYSQGTTSLLIFLSTKPEYNSKIKMAVNLAPVAHLKHAASPAFKIFEGQSDLLSELLPIFNLYEILPHHSITARLFHIVSTIPILREVNIFGIFLVVGFDSPQLDRDVFAVGTTHFPAGASSKQFLHYLQIRESDKFAPYDYGSSGNLKVYGQPEPPLYNLSQITTPVVLHYCANDRLSSLKDVRRLAEELPNDQLKLVPRSEFNHIDYVWATDIVELLNNDVVSEIKSFT